MIDLLYTMWICDQQQKSSNKNNYFKILKNKLCIYYVGIVGTYKM